MQFLFDRTVSVYRLTQDTGESPADIEEYILVDGLSSVRCQIQPLDDAYGEDFSGAYGKDFLMFCQENGIMEKDKIIDGDNEYIVGGVENYTFLGRSHSEVRIKLVSIANDES